MVLAPLHLACMDGIKEIQSVFGIILSTEVHRQAPYEEYVATNMYTHMHSLTRTCIVTHLTAR